jgi:hypothetical protein
LTSAICSLSTRSLKPILTPGESTTAFIAPWPITKPEIHNPSNGPRNDPPRERGFWNDYHALPGNVRARADKQFALLKNNPQHPSLRFKKLGDRNGQEVWSARVTLKYRALAVKLPDEYLWFWIGEHNVYDALIK